MILNKQFIIYGAGKQGQGYYEFLISKGLDKYIYGFCDRNYKEIGYVRDKKVYSYEEVREKQIPFLIAIADEGIENQIRAMLENDNNTYRAMNTFAEAIGEDRVAFNRDFCAFFHLHNMDNYFEAAEGENSIACFWGENTEFYRLFQQLDLSSVIELACGRGRHVPHYIEKTGELVLVDILEENIEFCKKRFKDCEKISYYCNNGYNLEKLESNRYSAVFSYDAVVHFEMMDIFEYLKDIYRVLITGGRVLIHHSNNDSDYKASFGNATNGRSFMSKKIFAYLAYRAGFEIIEQKVIDWGVKDLDCITLLEKR